MFSLSTIYLFALTAMAGVNANDLAAQADNAATLLSRFEPGGIPSNTAVLTALARLSESGTLDHLPLLESLAEEEISMVQSGAQTAISNIGSRHRTAVRSAFPYPTHQALTAWLSKHEPVGANGERLGRHEKHAVGYSALILGDHVGPYVLAWKETGYALEQAGKFRSAIRLYTAAILEGQFEAITELEEFPFNTEKLLLGVFTALPTEHPIRDRLMNWMVETGSIATVRIMADRTKRGSALERAMAIEALALMIREGKLKPNAADLARHRLERSARDPHTDISVFARTTLDELIAAP